MSCIAPVTPIIKLKNASLVFGTKTVLDTLNWQLMPGQHWAVIGHNGAGKSSFLRVLRGELRVHQPKHSAPAITWNFEGEDDASPLAVRPVASLLSPETQRHYVRQGWQLRGEDLILSGFGDAYMLYDQPSPAERQAATDLALKLDAENLLKMPVQQMSQGQLRLALFARALVKKPRLLLLDEAFDGLDAQKQKLLFEIIHEISKTTSIICTVHAVDAAPLCLTHLLELKRGKIIKNTPLRSTDDLAQNLRSSSSTQTSFAVRQNAQKDSANKKSSTVFKLHNADVYLQRKKVLHGINWEVKNGENWLISGPNGSGKSTLLRVLMGEEPVALGGNLKWPAYNSTSTLEARRARIGYVSDWLQNHYSYNINGKDLIISGLRGSIGLYQKVTSDETRKAEFWMNLLELEEFSDQAFNTMSEGLSRRFLLARALVAQPKILLLDEPCSGLDAHSKAEFMRFILLALEYGSQFIFVSHSQADLNAIQHKISHELRLQNGQVEYSGPFKASKK